jgi:hypothetical protein
MNDFNIAAILLKEYDHKKWDNLPKSTKIELVNDFLEFRNRIVIAANMGCLVKTFKDETEKAEGKYLQRIIEEKPVKNNFSFKMVEIKSETDLIREGIMKPPQK